tara:strand:+ start:42 stop:476 length:435 start_codon:yes stop_codon:yes gene_type:complete
MNDIYDLERFIKAQENSYEIALKEIKNGKKVSHWMWFIFPQIDGLGLSLTSKKYSIKNRQEAKDYLNHNILGQRLIEVTNALMELENIPARKLFGYPDDLKLKSSMTLFKIISSDNKIFSDVLVKYFNNQECEYTEKYFNSLKI